MYKSRFSRKRKAIQTILKSLKDEGPRRRPELLKASEVSEATLSAILDRLIKDGKIEAYTDPEDRRITWYGIKHRAEYDIIHNDSIDFIKTMESPICKEKSDTKQGTRVSATVLVELVKKVRDKYLEKIDESITVEDAISPSLPILFKAAKWLGTPPKNQKNIFSKWAFVITIENVEESSE